VSNPGLIFEVHDPQGAHCFYNQIVEFVGVGAATDPGNGFGAIDGLTVGVLFDEAVVASFLDAGGNFADGVVPGDVFPFAAARAADLRFE
jgi:hypothetical protein